MDHSTADSDKCLSSRIAAFTPYAAGESKLAGRQSVIKLSSNEAPRGPSEAAKAAFRAAVDDLSLYPSSGHEALRAAVAENYGIDPERIVCGAGSDEVLALVAQAFAGPGTEVIHTRHSFLMYPIFAKAVGAHPVSVDESERRAEIGNIVQSCNSRTRIVYLANPSNPTGTMLDGSELRTLADSLPKTVILVLDGAYAEFSDMDDGSMRLAHDRDNVVATRTFSKIHGLAALRVGFGYGSARIMSVLNRIREPFNVSGPSQAAAVAALGDRDFIARSQRENAANRKRLRKRLAELGVLTDRSFANFVLARFKDDAEAAACDDWFRKDGIIVRRMEAYGFSDCLRISIGTESDCDAVVQSIAAFRAFGAQ